MTVRDRCEAARRVFIAIPTYTSSIAYDTCFSLCQTIGALLQAGIECQMGAIEGNCYVDYARNILVQDFLESEATDLLFVDADVGFFSETVLAMCRATRPVVAAVYPLKDEEKESYPVNFLPGPHTLDSEGLIEAKMVPTGLLRVNRMVFESLKPHVKHYKNAKKDRMEHAYFRTDVREAYYGEDVEFCRIWRELGGKIRIVPNATLTHCGQKVWSGNVGNALRAGKF